MALSQAQAASPVYMLLPSLDNSARISRAMGDKDYSFQKLGTVRGSIPGTFAVRLSFMMEAVQLNKN